MPNQPTDEIMIRPVQTAEEKKKVLTLLQSNELPAEDIGEATRLFALWKDEVLIGSGGLEYYGSVALLRSVSVSGKAKEKGYGSFITANLEQIARSEGMRELILLTTTAGDFFTKQGYQHISRDQVPLAVQSSSEFASVCPASALVMSKLL